MPATNPFRTDGEWLKSQFHAHSLNSDGELGPEAVARQYAHHGFDVLTISDHWKLTKVDAPDGLLLIPGAELMVDPVGGPMCPEFLAIGIDDVPEEPSGDRANWYPYENCVIKTFATFDDGAAFVESFGGASVLCHPSWSGLPQASVFAAKAMHGVEVWNASSHRENDRGDSSYVWDLALDAGISYAPFGTDDSHYPAFDINDALDDGAGRRSVARGGRGGPSGRARLRLERADDPGRAARRRRGRDRVLAGARRLAAQRLGGWHRAVGRAARPSGGRRDPRAQRSRPDHAGSLHAGGRCLAEEARRTVGGAWSSRTSMGAARGAT